MFKRKVDKGVILAAGDGDRLGPLTLMCPKVVLPVNGVPLIRYPIDALVAAGISDIAIVVGYLGGKVMEELGNGSSFGARLQYVYNCDYRGGNAISLYRAGEWVQGEPIVLSMGVHLIEGKMVERLLDKQTSRETLCIDYSPSEYHQLAEATKVSVNREGCIKDIGKDLVYWDALDTGVFLLTQNFFRALDELVPRLGIEAEISSVIRLFINRGYRFDTCDASGCFWMDVDTEENLNMARM